MVVLKAVFSAGSFEIQVASSSNRQTTAFSTTALEQLSLFAVPALVTCICCVETRSVQAAFLAYHIQPTSNRIAEDLYWLQATSHEPDNFQMVCFLKLANFTTLIDFTNQLHFVVSAVYSKIKPESTTTDSSHATTTEISHLAFRHVAHSMKCEIHAETHWSG